MGDRNTGYDQTRDPRTGRPPLPTDAERIREEKMRQAEGRDYVPEGHEEATLEQETADTNEETVVVEKTGDPEQFLEHRPSDDEESDSDDEAAVETAVDDLESTDDNNR